MPVEFYDINDKGLKTILFALNDRDFEVLEPVLAEFKRLTGLVIDQYGTTRIHLDHMKLIIGLLDELLEKTSSPYQQNKELLEIREKFIHIESDVIGVGD